MSWGPLLLAAGALAVVWPRGAVRWSLPRLPHLGGLVRWARAEPRRAVIGAIGAVTLCGFVAGGPVGGVLAAVYAGLGGRALMRRARRRRAAADRRAELDSLAALAADLRAGLPPIAAGVSGGLAGTADGGPGDVAAGGPGGADDRLRRLTASVWRLAERTGAPAADLVERIEADARAADRAGASAAAQAAGAQATAMLLAALPVGGLALGAVIGADPLHVLLRTPLGAICAVAAAALQCAGLWWAERLVGGVTR